MERLTIPAAQQVVVADRDDEVVTAAARLFLRDGLDSVKMVDIADAAGLGVATLYRHFSTKANIAVAAATLLWRRFNLQLREIVATPEYVRLDGLHRLQVLLDSYCDAYLANGEFVRFLDEFDRLALSGQLPARDLATYGAEVDSLYGVFEAAYELGRADGSILRDIDFKMFYRALAHALIGVAQKLRRGEVIPSDDFSSAGEELGCIVRMAIWSLGQA